MSRENRRRSGGSGLPAVLAVVARTRVSNSAYPLSRDHDEYPGDRALPGRWTLGVTAKVHRAGFSICPYSWLVRVLFRALLARAASRPLCETLRVLRFWGPL